MKKKIIVTGKNGTLSTEVAKRINQSEEYTAEQVSLRDDSWRGYDFSSVDTIVHVAGMTPDKARSADDYYTVNTELTKELATAAKKAGVYHFVYLSSMAVYGVEQSFDISLGTVTKETMCDPKSDYGKSKLQAEGFLKSIEDEGFVVTVIRVPSIYGKDKTEYMDQYLHLSKKLPLIPILYEGHYKSVISLTNLCELIYLIVDENQRGIICPDDGEYSAVDFCRAIQPRKRTSRLLGKIMMIFFKGNARMLDYYGAVCYSRELSNAFDGRYRVLDMKEEVGKIYGK